MKKRERMERERERERERQKERDEREINSKMDHKSTQDQRKINVFHFFVAQNPLSQIFNFSIYSGLNFLYFCGITDLLKITKFLL